jgi:hypothetical protein
MELDFEIASMISITYGRKTCDFAIISQLPGYAFTNFKDSYVASFE